MYSITWIDGNKIASVSHPTERIIMQLWFAMRSRNVKVRMWDKNKQLIA